jgi:hypothetical protein
MMMNRREQTSIPDMAFEPTVSACKQSRPTPQIGLPLGPATGLVSPFKSEWYLYIPASLAISKSAFCVYGFFYDSQCKQ